MKERAKATGSPKVGVGEIDTRAPFQSVKDAVSLFGEGAFSGEKPAIRKAKPHSADRVLAKESQFHLAEKGLSKLKERLRNAENTKAEALAELEKARHTVDDLTQKLKIITESKEAAVKDTDAAKNQARELEEAKGDIVGAVRGVHNHDLESAREQYSFSLSALNIAKQELVNIRQDFEASLELKVVAAKQAAEAETVMKVQTEKAHELSKEILETKKAVEQIRQASLEVQQEHAEIFAEKDTQRQSHKAQLQEFAEKLQEAKKDFDPEVAKNLEAQLAQATSEIGALQKEIEVAQASDVDSVRTTGSDVDGAKELLHKVLEEEIALKSLLESLKSELETLRKEHAELKEKEAETESIAGNLHVKLRKSKAELEAILAEEATTQSAADDMLATLNQLVSETENARCKAEEMKIKAEELQKEAAATRVCLKEAEEQLKAAVQEADEAKAAEEWALAQIHNLSERANAARSSMSESGASITISREEFESLNRKVEESEKLMEMKVAAATAQEEAVKASENEALQRLAAAEKEITDTKAATEEALKKAEMAEAAKRAVEGELRRWREREQKKAAEAAARILAETQTQALVKEPEEAPVVTQSWTQPLVQQVATIPSPAHYKALKQSPSQKVKKMERVRTSVPKKTILPTISSIFQRKKSQIEVGSPSFLPGESPF
ncbi:hypothetical protein Droror1_Dr00014662 [Drosera rotundifolia]